jgi:Rad3-related DNA helicase
VSYALFRGIKKVILVSATIVPKTLDLLGLKDYRFHEYPSIIPVSNRPVVHWRTGVRLRFDTDHAGLRAWVSNIDQFISFRLPWKGIIHTVSYDRCRYLLEHSRYAAYFVVHGRRDLASQVAKFKRMPAPAILVSPSILTGFDFPGDECRWQIISKVPFPHTKNPVYMARKKDDPEYGMFAAVVSIVQAAGRGTRSAEDWCETVIVDDQISWLMRKYKKFAPRYFLNAYRDTVSMPPPLGRAR